MSEEKKEEQFTSAKELFEHNQKEIVKRKESYYDKLIDSLHLTTGKLDLLIVALLIIAVIIVVVSAKNK